MTRYKLAIMCYDSEPAHIRFVDIEVDDDTSIDDAATEYIHEMGYSLNSVEWLATKGEIEVLYGYNG